MKRGRGSVERAELLPKLDEILSELDACAASEDLEELAAELEDAIFLLDCAEDEEESDGALEEIADLAEELKGLAGADEALGRLALKLKLLLNTK